jgi:hypothetical protein
MSDATRHLIVDKNLLIYYLHPTSADTKTVRERCRVLFKAAINARWPGLRLHVPAISVAEAIGVLDKYRHCTWAGPVKQNAALRLNANQYKQARDELKTAIRQHLIEQIDHEPTHVSLAELISPINQKYQFRRRRKSQNRVKKPMGGADCMIAGMAVLLHRRLGSSQVALATADQRLADVVTKGRDLTERQAEQLGIKSAAEDLGIPWSSGVFPDVINLRDCPVNDLRHIFHGWPLPTSPCIAKTRQELTTDERDQLVAVWRRVARRHSMSNPDNLPHTPVVSELRTEFAADSGVLLSSHDVFHALVAMRKAGDLPRGH